MKFLVLMTLATLSYSAFAQTCYVDMVDRYNRVVRSYTGWGDPNTCIEGMKECRKAIRLEPQLGGVDCIRDNRQMPQPQPQPNPYPNPNPNPYPNPNPNPYPNPYPQPGAYPHTLIMGERVYNVTNSRYADVVTQDYTGKFVLRYIDNGATGTGWDRRDLAPLRGCDGDLCVGEEVYNVTNSRYARVEGLQMTNKFVLKYSDNNATGSGWDRHDLAVMKGCQLSLCVGQRVINVVNRRYAVVRALQSGNRFVLRYEDNGATGSGWNITDLAPIR